MSSRRGVIAFVFLVALLGSLVLYAALSLRRPTSPSILTSSVLVFDVPTEIEEGTAPFRPYSIDAFRYRDRPLLIDVVRGIRRAADDSQVRALVLHVDDLDWGWARLHELRDAIQRFRETGKPVHVSISSGGDAEYFLASAASRVSSPPTARISVDGLSMSAVFIRGTLDKLDIHPNFASVGEYKSAVESYTREDLSEPAREALAALLEDAGRLLVDSLSTARGLSPDSVRALLERGPYTASEALAAGLLDTLLYELEVDSLAVRLARHGSVAVPLEDYLNRSGAESGGARVAWVAMEGTIAPGRSRSSAMGERILGAESMVRLLREVSERRSVRAVVLRVDSPGGDAQASDEIWGEVRRLARRKPVIVSMSDVAASGGYYLALGGASIVAEPGTLTGSIGIYGGKFNILGLYRKLGLGVTTLTQGSHADMLSPFRDFTEDERAIFQRHLDEFYRGFVAKVADSRNLTEAAADSVARGRVWSGRAAFEHGLVDTLGGVEAAFALARRAMNVPIDEPIRLERYPQRSRTFLQKMMETLVGDEERDGADAALELFPSSVRRWAVLALLAPARPLAVLPFAIEIR